MSPAVGATSSWGITGTKRQRVLLRFKLAKTEVARESLSAWGHRRWQKDSWCSRVFQGHGGMRAGGRCYTCPRAAWGHLRPSVEGTVGPPCALQSSALMQCSVCLASAAPMGLEAGGKHACPRAGRLPFSCCGAGTWKASSQERDGNWPEPTGPAGAGQGHAAAHPGSLTPRVLRSPRAAQFLLASCLAPSFPTPPGAEEEMARDAWQRHLPQPGLSLPPVCHPLTSPNPVTRLHRCSRLTPFNPLKAALLP